MNVSFYWFVSDLQLPSWSLWLGGQFFGTLTMRVFFLWSPQSVQYDVPSAGGILFLVAGCSVVLLNCRLSHITSKLKRIPEMIITSTNKTVRWLLQSIVELLYLWNHIINATSCCSTGHWIRNEPYFKNSLRKRNCVFYQFRVYFILQRIKCRSS